MKTKQKAAKETAKPASNTWIYVMIGVIVVLGLIYVSYKSYLESKKIEYAGLNFEQKKFGDLNFYYTRIPLFDKNGINTVNYSMYLRNDPRTLEDIKIEGMIRIKSKTILASEPGLQCENNGIAGGELGQAIGLWTIVITGTSNKTLADNRSIPYVSCNASEGMYLDSTSLSFKVANVTGISQKGADCYEISVANCEILEAVERFIIGAYAHSRGIEI
jgi:hypothetical protein